MIGSYIMTQTDLTDNRKKPDAGLAVEQAVRRGLDVQQIDVGEQRRLLGEQKQVLELSGGAKQR